MPCHWPSLTWPFFIQFFLGPQWPLGLCLRPIGPCGNPGLFVRGCISVACSNFLKSVIYQHHRNLFILLPGCHTSDTKISLHLNGCLWELGGETLEGWLNGFMSSRVQGIRWASNLHVADRYAVDTRRDINPDEFSCWAQWKYYSGNNPWRTTTVYLVAAQFEAGLRNGTCEDLKPCSQQMCSILYQRNLQLNLVPRPIHIEIHSNGGSSNACRTIWRFDEMCAVDIRNSMGGNWRNRSVIGYRIGRKKDKIRKKCI